MPNIELKKLKACIVRTKDLIKNGEPVALSENICLSINCYAYALGILYNGTEKIPFNPGFTDGLLYLRPTPNQLIENICTDLRNLKISFRKLGLDDDIKLLKHEYLIKVFYCQSNAFLNTGDYHFIRQDPKTGYCFQKCGIFHQPEILQSNFSYSNRLTIEEPDIVISSTQEGFSYELLPIAYFAIKEPVHKKTSKKHKI